MYCATKHFSSYKQKLVKQNYGTKRIYPAKEQQSSQPIKSGWW